MERELEELLGKVEADARRNQDQELGEERWQKVKNFLLPMLAHYAEVLGFTQFEVLRALESRRDYWSVNYYQAANFPRLDRVRIFGTSEEIPVAFPSRRFRCPMCSAVSTNPYTCNSGAPMHGGDTCDWKAGGLFRTLGKGLKFTVRDRFLETGLVDEIFMPLEMETEAARG